MRNSPRSFLVEVVCPAYTEFINHYNTREIGFRQDTKNGVILAEALLDLPEHIFKDESLKQLVEPHSKSRSYRESFWQNNLPYEIICDFANAWKHRTISRQDRQLSSLDDIIEKLIIVKYQDDEGDYYVTRKTVSLICLNRKFYDLGDLLISSMQLWIDELIRLRVINTVPFLPMPISTYVSRSQANNLPLMKVLCQTGEYFEMHQGAYIYEPNSESLRQAVSDPFNAQYFLEFCRYESPFNSNETTSSLVERKISTMQCVRNVPLNM